MLRIPHCFIVRQGVVDLGFGTGVLSLTLLEEAGIQCIGLDTNAALGEQFKIAGYSVFHVAHVGWSIYALGCDGNHISHVIEHLWRRSDEDTFRRLCFFSCPQ
jgi:hypothetical protein